MFWTWERAPGGWSDKVGYYLDRWHLDRWPNGGNARVNGGNARVNALNKPNLVIGIDLLPHDIPPNLSSYSYHSLNKDTVSTLPSPLSLSKDTYIQLVHDYTTLPPNVLPECDLLLSDIAPNTTGTRSLDTVTQNTMALTVLDLAKTALSQNGSGVFKYFNAGDQRLIDEIRDWGRSAFKRSYLVKPAGSRKESREMFLVGVGKK